MGSRGFYLRGEIARFRKVLFDWAEDLLLTKGFELFYVPLMLNEKVMTGIGNLPDFDGQLYEVPIDENKNYYLIPSSEQSMMGFWMNKNLGNLDQPLLIMANTTCFRKESGSYGKDQQGILRTHQFEKIEIDAIYKPEDEDKVFEFMNSICQEMYNKLGIHYQGVEVCSGDLPFKHYRQVDYEAFFPGVDKFREICSNGSATDYQNRGLKITYDADNKIPNSNNCTGMVGRTMLAILEQFQTEDGKVKVPEVLVSRFGKEWLE
jgi:seryl-tRNA synthetase